MMTVEDVRLRYANVVAKKGDDEVQHSLEDDAYIAVLRAIADGAPDPAVLAREVLKIADIPFGRWCA